MCRCSVPTSALRLLRLRWPNPISPAAWQSGRDRRDKRLRSRFRWSESRIHSLQSPAWGLGVRRRALLLQRARPRSSAIRQSERASVGASLAGFGSSKAECLRRRTRSRAGPHSVLVYSVPEAARDAHSDTASQKSGTSSRNTKERMECGSCPRSLASFGTLYGFAKAVGGP